MNNNYNNYNNYNNQNMNNNNQFAPNNNMPQNNQMSGQGMPQNNQMPVQGMPQVNNQGSFTGVTPNMVNNQVQNQSTFVNNEPDKNEVYAIIEKNLPKLMKGNGSKTSGYVFLIIGGFFLLLGLVLYFVMEEDSRTAFLILGIIMGVIFIPMGLFKLSKAGKYPVVDYNIIKQELYGTDCMFIKEAEIFFTRNHVVKYGSNRFIFPYSEIAMAYPQEHPQSTATVNTGGLAGALISGAIAATQTAVQMAKGNQDIVIKTKRGVKEVFFAHKKEDEILTILQEKVPGIMIGNTKENRQAYKEVKETNEALNQQVNKEPVQAMNMGMNPLPPQNNQPMPNQNMNRGPMPQQPMPNQNYNRGPMPNNGMPQQQPNNGMYQRPNGGQPRSYSSNINDQQIFNRF